MARRIARVRRWAIAAGAVAALLLVAAALTPHGFALSPSGRTGRQVIPALPPAADYILIGLAVIATAVAVGFLFTLFGGQERGPRAGPVPLWAKAVIVLLLIGAAFMLDSVFNDGRLARFFGRLSHLTRPPSAHKAHGAGKPVESPALGNALATLFGVALLLALVGIYWMLRRPPLQLADALEKDPSAALLQEVDLGIDDLAGISDPRAAVVACYRRMERTIVAAGVARRRSDTPFELLARFLEQHSVAGDSARRLTDLFETARFSRGDIDETMRTGAIAALTDVRDQLQAAIEERAGAGSMA